MYKFDSSIIDKILFHNMFPRTLLDGNSLRFVVEKGLQVLTVTFNTIHPPSTKTIEPVDRVTNTI